jgi:ClpP class serine protease
MLALEPRAFGMIFETHEEQDEIDVVDGVAVVSVCGPLMHHDDWWFDSYDGVKSRVAKAVEIAPKAVLLSVDSPGGLVSGCFDTAREIRKICDEAGVPLYAYVDGQATSAAYALVCVASKIFVPETGIVGSIGVIDTLVDVTANDVANGISYKLVVSGARKADGNPHTPITAEALAATQKRVNGLAEVFFLHVAESRGTTVQAVQALEAGMFHGIEALSMGLADQIGTFDSTLAAIIAGDATEDNMAGKTSSNASGPKAASKPYEDAIAALRKAAEGDDEEAKKAKRMLAAELADDKDGDGSDEPAATDDPPAPAPDKKEEEDAKAIALRALAKVHSMEAAQAKATVEQERAQLLASRPDFAPEMQKILATASIETVRDMCANLPKVARAAAPAASAVVPSTRGEGQGDGTASRLPPSDKLRLDQAMGIAPQGAVGAEVRGNRLVLGVPTQPVQTAGSGPTQR